MHIIAGFVISFVISCTGSFVALSKSVSVSNSNQQPEATVQPKVLAVASESTPNPTELSTPTPTITPSPTPIPTATSTPSPSSTATPTPTSTPTNPPGPTATPDVWSPAAMEPWFAQYAGQYGVDKNVLERIANCESHFNPVASNGDYLGIFQFSTSTWINYRQQMRMDTNPDLRTNAEESIRTGAFLVSKRGIAPWPSCV